MYYRKHIARRTGIRNFVLSALGCIIALCGLAASVIAAPEIELDPIITGLYEPVAITHAGGGSDRLFITLLTGQILIFSGQQVLARPFLDIASLITSGSERGLFSVAFHPDYAANGFLFVDYTDLNGGLPR